MPRLLNRIVDDAALRQPGAPAIRSDGETLSYEQLARRANGLARVLVGTGLARGDSVAVWLARGPNVPVSFYGVLAAGGTLVPIDPRSPIEQVVRILRATGTTRIVSEPERSESVSRALARTRVVREGVIPSLRVDYKSNSIKQYFKEGRALRTELTVHNPGDFGLGRKMENLPALRELGFQTNRRVLHVQKTSQDFIMSEALFREVTSSRSVDAPAGFRFAIWRPCRARTVCSAGSVSSLALRISQP